MSRKIEELAENLAEITREAEQYKKLMLTKSYVSDTGSKDNSRQEEPTRPKLISTQFMLERESARAIEPLVATYLVKVSCSPAQQLKKQIQDKLQRLEAEFQTMYRV